VDAFEQVVSEILWREGYWVRTSIKVELTADDKKAIKRPTSPRWEIDVVGYSPADNLLRVVECKSFIDSLGVGTHWLDATNKPAAGRYKLFSDANLRKVVLDRLSAQFIEAGMCLPKPKIKLCLACGKIRRNARGPLAEHFKKNGWELFDEEWLRDRIRNAASGKYENQVSAVVAKLLVRGSAE
jgi:hypothetical protein